MNESKKLVGTKIHELIKKNRKLLTILFWVFLLVIYFVISYVLSIVDDLSAVDKKWLKEILHPISVAIIEILFLGVIYEYITKGNLIQEFAERISESIALDKEILTRFTVETKSEFIKNIIEAVLGDSKGPALYENMVQPYISNGGESFRESYDYYIDFKEMEGDIIIENNEILFDRSRYYMVTQNFKYEKFIDLTTEEHFSIGFVFEDKTLDCWFRKDRCIFREVLRLDEGDEGDRNKLKKLIKSKTTKEEKINVLNEIVKNFGMEITIDSTKILTTRIEMEDGEDDRFSLIADYSGLPGIKSINRKVKFQVKFQMPQAKSYNRFSVFIPEPTFAPFVHFCYDKEGMQHVTPITFFAGKEPIDPDYIEYAGNNVIIEVGHKWIFPRSGVVFVWDNK